MGILYSQKPVVAIDGPAAAGKSTTAKMVAKALEFAYIDTGAMYRACALITKKAGIPHTDLPSLQKALQDLVFEFRPGGNLLFVNGEDVSEAIRTPEMSRLASEIAVIPMVRTLMVNKQRRMGEDGGVVMDGRDIGTNVFPNARFKFFLVAGLEERARRRCLELEQKGQPCNFQDVMADLAWRDANDSGRAVAPLKKADDAIEIDTTGLSIDEQADIVISHIKRSLTNE